MYTTQMDAARQGIITPQMKIVAEKEEQMRGIEEFIREEDGIGVVEIILILVVLIGLIAIFKTKMSSLIKDIFTKIGTQWKTL